MKILLTSATGYPSPDTGGPNKIIFNLLKGIRNDKYKLDYISKHFQFNSNQYYSVNSVNYVNQLRNKLYLNNRFYRSIVTNPLYLHFHYNKLENFFKGKVDSLSDYDCLNSHDILSYYYLRKFNKKKILTIHSKGSLADELKNAIKLKSSVGQLVINKIKEMEKISFDEASYVTFPSLAAKNMFLESIGSVYTDKIKIIYNGIDLFEINQIEKSELILNKYKIPKRYTHYLFNVANHIKFKNIDKIIIAVELLVKKYKENICLINAGTGPLVVDLKRMAYRLGLGKNIFFLGIIPNEDVIKLMKYCDYFIMSSENVVFDMVILEALASGTIVIASYRGGNKEVIKDSINGYFLYDNEPEEIAQKILRADKKVISGAVNTIKSFSLNSMIEKYSEIYAV